MERRVLIAAAVLSGISRSGTALAQTGGDTQALIERFAATLSAHDMAAFAELFADDYVNHQRSAAAPRRRPAGPPNRARSISSRPG